MQSIGFYLYISIICTCVDLRFLLIPPILALNKLIEKLDNRLEKKRGAHYVGFTRLPRLVGVSSLSNAPENAPEWAVTTSNALKLSEFMCFTFLYLPHITTS